MNARSAIVAAIALAGAAASAHAGTVNLRFISTGQGQNVKIKIGASQVNVFAGQLIHEFTNGVGSGAGLTGQMVTFCTDLTEHVTSISKVYDVVGVKDIPAPSMGVEKAAAINDMYRYANGQQFGSAPNADFAAAFQIAVWEVVTDFTILGGRSSLDVTLGAFTAKKTDGSNLSVAIANNVNSLFNAIGTFGASGPAPFGLIGLANDGAQDQIVLVPLPAASGLAGAGLFGLTGIRRRRQA